MKFLNIKLVLFLFLGLLLASCEQQNIEVENIPEIAVLQQEPEPIKTKQNSVLQLQQRHVLTV